uniref:SHSP domain-containing protein n=1 Tax=Panagrolaimus sp. JU765 TaxID=591449 RepID=A0AC34QGL8_9BILA
MFAKNFIVCLLFFGLVFCDESTTKSSMDSSTEDLRKSMIGTNPNIFVYSPFRWPSFRDPFREMMKWDPFKDFETMMNQMMDSRIQSMNNFREISNTFGDISVNDNDFKYSVNLEGFKPEELKIKLDGEQLVISGDHREVNENGTETVHQSFIRRFTLPDGFKKETIKSIFDGKGNLIVSGQRNPQISQENAREIPIETVETASTPETNEKKTHEKVEV